MIRAHQLLKQCRPGTWEHMYASCVQSQCLRSLWVCHAAVQMGPCQQGAAVPLRRGVCKSSSSSSCFYYSRHSDFPCSSSTSSSGDHRCVAGLQQRHTGALVQTALEWRESLLPIRQQASVGALRHTSSGSGRAAKAQENIMKQMAQHEFKSPTLGSILDPYRRSVPLLQSGILYSPARLASWLYNRYRSWLHTYTTGLKAKSYIPDFHKKLMVEEVARLYQKISQAQAEYRLHDIKDLVDEKLYTRMRAQAEERRISRWDEIIFELVEDESRPLKSTVKLVHGRAISTSKDSPIVWIQLTYSIRSQQRFAAYKVDTGKGTGQPQRKLVYGNPDEVLAVEDHWVFEYKARMPVEKSVLKSVRQDWPGARWRLVGRLAVSLPG